VTRAPLNMGSTFYDILGFCSDEDLDFDVLGYDMV
jgi:hypothetical protein